MDQPRKVSMDRRPLHLLFPQWQGSGRNNALFYAANALAESCPQIDFTRVPVPEHQTLQITDGILGYDGILSQMTAARRIVAQEAPDRILTVGGDCGIEPVPVSYLNRKHDGQFTLVWLDAHADLNTPETSPSGCYHGMPLATLLGLGNSEICGTCFSRLEPDQIILAGVRDLDPAEAGIIEEEKITCIKAAAMADHAGLLAEKILDRGDHPVYIHIDLDVLDPVSYPYVRHPEACGLAIETLHRVLAQVRRQCRVAGLGLMEFSLEPFEQMSNATGCPRSEWDKKGLDTVINLMTDFKDVFSQTQFLAGKS